ncbi:MAG: PVC-type heme-binding CxxCH protein [Planctomycetota bacterium]
MNPFYRHPVPRKLCEFAWMVLLPFLCHSPLVLAFQSPVPGVDDDPPKVLRAPRLTIAEAIQALEVLPGFQVELVASEPLIRSPVAIQFDASGALWVVEMVDYSEQGEDALGRLSRLEDRDEDGAMDHSEIVAERLSWPTAVACLERATWVAAPPYLWQYSTVGDIETPVQNQVPRHPENGLQSLLEGLGRQNVQGMANSFRWGLDGKLHLSTSSNGGALQLGLRSSLHLPSTPLNVNARDLAFDLNTGDVTTIVGYGQHGMDFTPWGDRLLTGNSDHLQQVAAWYLPELTDAVLSRPVAWRRSIAIDGPQAEVYRLSPVESWRTIRTQMRLTGASTGLLEGNGRASGYFTSATGVVVYDGDQWGGSEDSVAFVADVGSNLVHRKRLLPNPKEAGLIGERMDVETEFLRSRDTWFRPVQMANGPDGCLYVVDMARETIEHPKSLPEPIKSQLDLTSGRELGRIWRVRAKEHPIRRSGENWNARSSKEIIELLASRNGWHRETAAQLLIQRSLREPIDVVALQTMAVSHPEPLARLHALSVLASISQGWDQALWIKLLKDPHPRVRLWSVVFSDRIHPALTAEEAWNGLSSLREETDVDVRIAACVRAYTLIPDVERRVELLTAWSQRDPRPDELRAAVEMAARGPVSKRLWDRLKEAWTDDALANGPWIDAMFFQMQAAGTLTHTLEALPSPGLGTPSDNVVFEAIARLLERRGIANGSPTYAAIQKHTRSFLTSLWEDPASELSEESLLNGDVMSFHNRERSLAWWMSTLSVEERLDWLKRTLSADVDTPLQIAAIEAWVSGEATLQDMMVDRLSSLPPLVQQAAIKALLKTEVGANRLLDGLDQEQFGREIVHAWAWQILRSFPTEGVRSRASKWDRQTEVPWETIASHYRVAWRVSGDASRGEVHFKKWCASCHRVADIGIALGPSLDSYRVRPNEAIALAIAEPSREMDPKYEQHQVVTHDGRIVIGLLKQNDKDQLVLLTTQNETVAIPRPTIEQWKSSGRSMMPDGLLKEIDPVALNDLIAFLRKIP